MVLVRRRGSVDRSSSSSKAISGRGNIPDRGESIWT